MIEWLVIGSAGYVAARIAQRMTYDDAPYGQRHGWFWISMCLIVPLFHTLAIKLVS